ncbi:hypothetical protein DND90_33145 [Pseudomonas syringae pv. maculicola]|nr:hypothetical protein DND90_33145 [Pseudomonas syringae pv. maculicola]
MVDGFREVTWHLENLNLEQLAGIHDVLKLTDGVKNIVSLELGKEASSWQCSFVMIYTDLNIRMKTRRTMPQLIILMQSACNQTNLQNLKNYNM